MYSLLILSLPDDIFRFTSLFAFSKLDTIPYDTGTIYFSYLFIPLFVFFILNFIDNNFYIKNIILFSFYFIFYLLFKESLIYFTSGKNYVFNYGDFSYYIVFITAFTLIIGTFKYAVDQFKYFFQLFVYIHSFSTIILVIFSLNLINNRFNAVNLDVGSTGFLYGAYLIFNLYRIKKFNFFNLCEFFYFLILLYLTGSRTNIFLSFIYILIYLILFFLRLKFFSRTLNFSFVLAFFLTTTLLIFFIDRSINLSSTLEYLINRISSFNLEDDSVIGRYESLFSGIRLLFQKPFGITFSHFHLQFEIQNLGYPTFPHYNWLYFYLLIGPLFIFVIVRLFYYVLILYRRNDSFYVILLYLLSYSTIAGGGIINFKIIFLYLLFIIVGWYKVRKKIFFDHISQKQSILKH